MLTEGELKTIVERIVHRADPEQVIVFGSYAKGNATPKSDLDIFVVQNTSLPAALRTDALKGAAANPFVAVDVHVYSPEEVAMLGKEEYSFVWSVLKTGKIYFQRDAIP